MKSSDEMYKSLLTRRDEYMQRRSKRNKALALTIISAAVVLLIGVGAWHIGGSVAPQRNAEHTAQADTTRDTTAQSGITDDTQKQAVSAQYQSEYPWSYSVGKLIIVDITAYDEYSEAADDTELQLWLARLPKARIDSMDDSEWETYLRESAEEDAGYLRRYCSTVTVNPDESMINGFCFICMIKKSAFDLLGEESEYDFLVKSLQAQMSEADRIGMIVVNGREYREIGWGNPEGYTKKEFLGKASDFEGNYRTHEMAYDGDLYSTNESGDVLMLFTDVMRFADNNGVVVFKASDAQTVITDRIAQITVDGITYRHATSFNADDYTKKECIGRASDFEGTYKDVPEVDGDVYTVNETEKVLIIMLDNGGIVVLKAVE